MIAKPAWRAWIGTLLTVLLAACADGGGETGTGVTPSTGSAQTTRTGVITGFGSIFVNGIEFETSATPIMLDGVRGTEHDLAVGMIVTVRGSVDANRRAGTASRVQYSSEVDGVVLAAAISPRSETGTLNVMGRTVMIDENTVYDSADSTVTSIAQVAAGSIVQVSGHASGESAIHATRVALKSATYDGREIEVKGVVTNLMDDSFNLGTLHVVYTGAGVLAPGWYVEVHSTQGVANNQLVATTVTKLADNGNKSSEGILGEAWSGQGVITRAIVDDTFALSGVTINILDSTEYLGGSSADLVLDRRVNVDGTVSGNGIVRATSIEIVPAAEFGLDAAIQSTDANGAIATLLGADFTVDGETILKDDRDRLRNFNLGQIATGDRVELRFARAFDGGLRATKLVRKASSTALEELEGPILAADGLFSIGGIPVTFINCVAKCKPPPNGADVELAGTWTGTSFSVKSYEPND